MRHEGRGTSTQSHTYIDTPVTDRCSCPPLTTLHKALWQEQEAAEDVGRVIPAARELNTLLRTTLSPLFPRSTPISLMLLHIFQLEHIHIAPKSTVIHKRHRYHAPDSFLEQVLVNVRRTIRACDQVLMHNGTGAAIVFPEVDQEGIFNILERVYHSINLLQSDTVIPPLKRETEILIGIGSSPKPGPSLEDLLYHTGLFARRITLRPAVITQLRSINSSSLPEPIDTIGRQNDDLPAVSDTHKSGVPYMRLPVDVPPRLKQLIPYGLASEIRCIPVGRDHNRLTVAMADPINKVAIRLLREATGLSIFPVSCDAAALDLLLANEW